MKGASEGQWGSVTGDGATKRLVKEGYETVKGEVKEEVKEGQ